MAGLVYFLRSGDSSLYKIGRTQHSVEKRKKGGLATGNPDILHEIKTWDCGQAANVFEHLLHNVFVKQHVVNRDATEFFDFTGMDESDVVDRIDALFVEFLSDWRDMPVIAQSDDGMLAATSSLQALMAERRELQGQIKVLEYYLAMKDAKIKAELGGHAGIECNGRPVLTWKEQTTVRLDQQALKARHPELVAEFSKQSTSRVFRFV